MNFTMQSYLFVFVVVCWLLLGLLVDFVVVCLGLLQGERGAYVVPNEVPNSGVEKEDTSREDWVGKD